MLVLTRRISEEVYLRDTANMEKIGSVMVLGIKGNQVRLGFDFGQEINIIRKEIERIFKEGEKLHGEESHD